MGGNDRRFHERICDHGMKDSKSYVLKRSLENNHRKFGFEEFCI